MKGQGAGDGSRQSAERRDCPQLEELEELTMKRAGSTELVCSTAIVRVHDDRVGGVDESVTGKQHVLGPGQILGNQCLAKR